MQEPKRVFTPEMKAQIIKEVQDTGSITVVAKIHGIPRTTLSGWIQKTKKRSESHKLEPIPDLRKKLEDTQLEILVLKELLKKTNQAWLKE